jgi:hypothetical protein
VEIEAARRKSRPESACEMRPALAPIQAWPAEGSARRALFAQVDAEFQQERLALRRDHAAVFGELNMVPRRQRVGQRHAEAPGQMVVAGARIAQRLAAAPSRLVAGRTVCRYRHDAFEHSADHR